MTQFAEFGFDWRRAVVDSGQLKTLRKVFPNQTAGARLSSHDIPHEAIASVTDVVRGYLPNAFFVRAVSFDKGPQTNWGVGWHQDRIIRVRERVDTPGFGNWSKKCGVWHCQPPIELLRNMIFVRLFLDDVDSASGGMEFIPNVHPSELISEREIDTFVAARKSEIEQAKAGDMLVLSMLSVHRSVPSRVQKRRRILRLDFANCPLPAPLEWFE